ncbi:hypothetical protein BGZ94_009019 [Podila epigama]|nr:hypothetical protein BGZ94_009019 [Podila epigama]
MNELPLVRPVANLERYLVAQGNTDVYYNVVVGTRVAFRPPADGSSLPRDQTQWVALLSPALAWLVQERPALSVVIGDHLTTKPVFRRLPSLDLTRIIRVDSIQKPEDVTKVLEYEHAHPFDLANHEVPLWRIVVAHVESDDSFYLLYTFQHSISDGRSGMMFSQLLVERLNHEVHNPSPASANPAIIATSSESLPPPLEECFDCSPGLKTLVKEATMILFLPGPLKRALEPKYWSGEVDASAKQPHRTIAGILVLNQEETKQVIAAAKAQKTTVNSVIYAASLFAVKSVFLSDKNNKALPTTKDKFSHCTAVAVRHIANPPIEPTVQGFYISEVVRQNIKVQPETSFWDMTRAYGASIAKAVQPKGGKKLLEHVGLLAYLPKSKGAWEKFCLDQYKKLQHGRETSVRMSNLGKAWEQSGDEAFKVLHPVFSQTANTTASAFSFNAATGNNSLVITNTWQESTFTSRDKPDRVLAEFKRVLLAATAPENSGYSFRDTLV